jgi:hypothetical protein
VALLAVLLADEPDTVYQGLATIGSLGAWLRRRQAA